MQWRCFSLHNDLNLPSYLIMTIKTETWAIWCFFQLNFFLIQTYFKFFFGEGITCSYSTVGVIVTPGVSCSLMPLDVNITMSSILKKRKPNFMECVQTINSFFSFQHSQSDSPMGMLLIWTVPWNWKKEIKFTSTWD